MLGRYLALRKASPLIWVKIGSNEEMARAAYIDTYGHEYKGF